MSHNTRGRLVRIASIVVPERYSRRSDLVEDDKLLQSVVRTGIQQPLIVSQLEDDSYVLIDGCRRLQIARYLKMSEVPCVIDEIPEGIAADEYRDRIRFILAEHRQDLSPGQRSKLIENLKSTFHMNNREVGEYLGVDPTTIANWLQVASFIPEVIEAIDSEEITQHAARAFVGMTHEGQRCVWEEQKEKFKILAAGRLHRLIREQYHPNQHPGYYHKPEKVIEKLNRPKAKRTAVVRPVISKGEKETLLKDIELKEAELRDTRMEIVKLMSEISLATPLIRAILQNDALLKLVPQTVKEDFERFAEVYI